ncbi:MAG: SUMF1/EgtB/PvdO family nonheme iron enzyme, partial [Treponema sp.]|nr:SUMF1/EgtB/PvdO family nonheme iron enzyme [Treponema sp.]
MRFIKKIAGVTALLALLAGIIACNPTVEVTGKTYASPVTFTSEDLGVSGIKVTLSTATTGAKIYYTTDKTNPTTGSSVYSGSLTFTNDATIKAYAVKDGMEPSPVSVAQVTIKTGSGSSVTPVISEGGTYTVYHYQQNVNGGKTLSDYTLFDTENSKSIIAGTSLDEIKKAYTGFTAKSMALNEKVIYVFYNRNTITYTFETGSEGKFSDSSVRKTVEGLYGASVTKPANPQENDSTNRFIKWETSDGKACPATFGAENMTFKAVWGPKGSASALLSDKVINSVTLSKTSEVEVLTTSATVNMADDSSWSGYISSSSSDYYKGVFIKNRSVTLSPFSMGQYEVTQELYNAVLSSDSACNANPSNFTSSPASGETQKLRPVEYVTWYDAVYFCNALTKLVMTEADCVYTITNITRDSTNKYISSATVEIDMTKKGYRLPTEAEWEFAARGGDATADAWKYSYAGANTSETNLTSQQTDTALNDYGWYTSNSSSKTHEVGKKTANTLGLYDMSGNVWEWCWDWYSSTVSTTAVT